MKDLFINSRNRSLGSYMQREIERHERNKVIFKAVYFVVLVILIVIAL